MPAGLFLCRRTGLQVYFSVDLQTCRSISLQFCPVVQCFGSQVHLMGARFSGGQPPDVITISDMLLSLLSQRAIVHFNQADMLYDCYISCAWPSGCPPPPRHATPLHSHVALFTTWLSARMWSPLRPALTILQPQAICLPICWHGNSGVGKNPTQLT